MMVNQKTLVTIAIASPIVTVIAIYLIFWCTSAKKVIVRIANKVGKDVQREAFYVGVASAISAISQLSSGSPGYVLKDDINQSLMKIKHPSIYDDK